MKKTLLALMTVASLALSACGGAEPPPQVVQGADGKPVAIQQSNGPSFMEMAGAAAVGNVVGNLLSGTRGNNNPTVVSSPTTVHKTVVNKTVIVQPPAPTTAPKVAPPPPRVAPVPRTTPSYSRPSSSFSRSSSSFGSSRRR